MTTSQTDWIDFNQRYLTAALAEVRTALERHASRDPKSTEQSPVGDASCEQLLLSQQNQPALEVLCATFRLTTFERALLLLCAGMELESKFAGLCAKALGDSTRSWPTFGLALAALQEPHWSALSPNAPLRHWRLIEILTQPTVPLTMSQFRIDERLLAHSAGLHHLDERLIGFIEPIAPADELAPS